MQISQNLHALFSLDMFLFLLCSFTSTHPGLLCIFRFFFMDVKSVFVEKYGVYAKYADCMEMWNSKDYKTKKYDRLSLEQKGICPVIRKRYMENKFTLFGQVILTI